MPLLNFDLDSFSHSWVGDEDPQHKQGLLEITLGLPESCVPMPIRPWNLKLRICLGSFLVPDTVSSVNIRLSLVTFQSFTYTSTDTGGESGFHGRILWCCTPIQLPTGSHSRPAVVQHASAGIPTLHYQPVHFSGVLLRRHSQRR